MGASGNHRRHPLVAETTRYLRHLGADAIAVTPRKTKFRLAGTVGEHTIVVVLPRTERDVEVQGNMARQQVRRRFRDAGIEVRA